MSKKSFKNNLQQLENPALQFISGIIQEEINENDQANQNSNLKNENQSQYTPPENFKIIPESKSKRLQLLIQPSLFQLIKLKAQRENSSVNDTIHKILSDYLRSQ